MTYVRQLLGQRAPRAGARRPPQLYGVEIEVENCHNVGWADEAGWQVIGDGSLRGAGIEFISPPVEYATLKTMLMAYYHAHHENGYHANTRTGIHVHMDMRCRTLEQVAAICAVYAIVEPILFSMCGPEREECIYCVPWYRATEDIKLLRTVLDNPGQAAGHINATCKYAALYLEPLLRFGTIEFRQAPTFVTYEEMMLWVDAIRRLVVFGEYRKTPEEVLDYDLDRLIGFIFPGLDLDLAKEMIEENDSLGVAAYLVRTKPKMDWSFPEAEPMAQSGVYYRHAGGRARGGELRMGRAQPRFVIEQDHGDEVDIDEADMDEEYNEEEY
jgi:hypothetical protein